MATTSTEQLIRDIALLEEIKTSSKLIKLGFGELQNLNQSNNFYFLPFQILSQGFERLMKCHICLGYYNKYGNYPNLKYIKDLGHDLESLKKVILVDFFEDNHNVLSNDKQFLQKNTELEELLYILSEFGKMARYHNFDVITGNSKPSINAKELWVKFENKLLFSNPKSINKITDWDLRDELYGEHARHIIILFEKFVSALSRQFIWGHLGNKGKQYSSDISDFNIIFEKEFGIKDYRKNTTRYTQTPLKVHTRTLKDAIERKINPNFKSKKIHKNEYKGDWPFYVDEVIVECREKRWCIVTIDNKDYALNGNAKGRYKLENPCDAGMAILGKSFGEFITIAMNL